MSTLGALKSRIADDIARSDLATQIGEAITDAITYYSEARFFFNETRSSTFATVADQSTYSVVDDADIPLWLDLEEVWLTDSSGEAYNLRRVDWAGIEGILDNSAASGRPYSYAYGESSFRLYPIPDAVYTVRPIGVIEKAAPAGDDETGNVWMTKAFELIRCRAKWYLYGHVIRDYQHAQAMGGVDGDGGATGAAMGSLRSATAKRVASGRITPTQF